MLYLLNYPSISPNERQRPRKLTGILRGGIGGWWGTGEGVFSASMLHPFPRIAEVATSEQARALLIEHGLVSRGHIP